MLKMNYLCGFTRGFIHRCNSIPTGMFYERKYDAIIVLLLKMNVFLYNWRPHNTVRVHSNGLSYSNVKWLY